MNANKNGGELIELYLSDEDHRFVKGMYYDVNAKPHDLTIYIHVGLVVDSCLVHPVGCDVSETVCRYYIQPDAVKFYDVLYREQSYVPFLIHNCSDKPMKIELPYVADTWSIEPRCEMLITPRVGAL